MEIQRNIMAVNSRDAAAKSFPRRERVLNPRHCESAVRRRPNHLSHLTLAFRCAGLANTLAASASRLNECPV